MSQPTNSTSRRLTPPSSPEQPAPAPAVRWPQVIAAPASWEAGFGPHPRGGMAALPQRSYTAAPARPPRPTML